MFKLAKLEDMLNLNSTELKAQLDARDELSYPLLLSLFDSYHSHIVQLPRPVHLSCMKTDHQFFLQSESHSKQAAFDEAKEKYGSIFAFHGSDIGNWHSIIRTGLMNASGTDMMTRGAMHGEGIYVSPKIDISYSFSSSRSIRGPSIPRRSSEKSSFFRYANHNLFCMALCEVVTSPAFRKVVTQSYSNKFTVDEIWLVSNPDHIATRFLFVWEDNLSAKDVDTGNPVVNEQILRAMTHMHNQ